MFIYVFIMHDHVSIFVKSHAVLFETLVLHRRKIPVATSKRSATAEASPVPVGVTLDTPDTVLADPNLLVPTDRTILAMVDPTTAVPVATEDLPLAPTIPMDTAVKVDTVVKADRTIMVIMVDHTPAVPVPMATEDPPLARIIMGTFILLHSPDRFEFALQAR